MGEQNTGRRWIVLLNKAPKGPFSATEIQELLDKGVLRRNDLASVVESSPSKKGEWKLIWQFVEFDRRSLDTATTKPSPLNKASENTAAQNIAADRRKAEAAEEARQKALAELPPNWDEIRPEDLTPHSTSTVHQETQVMPVENFEKSLVSHSSSSMRLKLAFGAVATLVITFFFFNSVNKKGNVASALPQAPNTQIASPPRLPAQVKSTAPVASSAPIARPRIPMDARVEDNLTAERGEIDEEEVPPPIKKRTIKRKRARDSEEGDEEAVEGEAREEENRDDRNPDDAGEEAQDEDTQNEE